MPGTERIRINGLVQRAMDDTELTEDQLFEYRPEEGPRIMQGTIHLLPQVDKERILDYLQEVIRVRIDIGGLVARIRGEPYVRSMMARGEDFIFVAMEPNENLALSPVSFLLQRLSKYMESKYGIFMRAADLGLEITGGEPLPNIYTMLDVVYVAATSRFRTDHFEDHFKILRVTLDYRPRVTPLGPAGLNLL